MSYEDSRRNKRLAIIGVCSLLVITVVVFVTTDLFNFDGKDSDSEDINDENQNSKYDQISTSKNAIKSFCQSTMYRDTCQKSLEKHAGKNATDAKQLMKIAFAAAEEEIVLAAKTSDTLNQLENDTRSIDALHCCKELMNMSFVELRHSFDQVDNLDLGVMTELVDDLKTWLSAAITYQETCLDGFKNASSGAGQKMSKALKTAMETSSNGLDIVSGLSVMLLDLQLSGFGRRLLQDDQNFPTWIDAGSRRLLRKSSSKVKPNIVVAQDGSGHFKTIRAAMSRIPKNRKKTFVLYIKKGIYKEYLVFNANMTNLLLIGDGPDKTRITGNKSFAEGLATYHTATVVIGGENFTARNIGFENSAGPEKQQAVALRVSADHAIFQNCSMDGYQSTLYAHSKRQFYRNCSISGTIDFVSGDALAVFQNCKLLVRKPLDGQKCVVTAQSRKQERQPSGIVIHNSTITAHSELIPVKKQFKTYLGRPSKQFSRTVIMESFIDDLIEAEGWTPWSGSFGLETCYYAEFNNYGPGSSKKGRVKWNGIKNITREEAMEFTPDRFMDGEYWLKPSGVRYLTSPTRS